MKPFDVELTSGAVTRSVWKLAWPMILLNLVNGLHSLVDHLLVGNFVPSEANEANAGIGIAWQLFLVVVVFIVSLLHGMNVLVARYAGRRDRETLSRIVYQTFLAMGFILLFIGAPVGYFAAPYLLNLLHADPAVQVHALPYMRILFTCGVPLFLVYLLTGALQASGNPKVPLALGVLTTALNVLISTFLIVVFKLGVVGAALGTCLAPIPGIAIALRLIYTGKTIVQPPSRLTLRPDFAVLKAIARVGIPGGLQAVVMNVGGAILLAVLGRLEHSAAAQAAYAICYSQVFMLVVWASFGLRVASSTVIGQNIGAGNTERGVRGVYVAAAMGIVWAALLGLVFWTYPEAILALFDATGDAIRTYGVTLLRYLSFSGVAFALGMAFTGGLQGAGDTKSPMYIAAATQLGVLLGICEIALLMDRLTAHVVWTAILASHVARFLLSYLIFQRRRWTAIRIEVDGQ